MARGADRRRPGARRARGARRRRAPDPRRVHRLAALRRDAGRARRRRHRRGAVRSGRARAAPARLLLVAAEGVRVHGLGPAGRRAGAAAPAGDSRRTGEADGVLYDGAAPGALAAALDALADADRRRRLGAAARARAEQHFSWAAHCRTLDAAIAAMRATTARARDDDGRIPPRAARHRRVPARLAAAAAGARTSWLAGCARTAIASRCCGRGPARPAGLRVVADAFDGFDVHELGGPSPPIPFVRNYVKNERLAPRLAPVVARSRPRTGHRRRARPAPAVDSRRHRRRARRRCPGRRHHPRLLAGLLLVGSDPRSIERDAVPGVLGRDDDALRARPRRPAPGRRRCRSSPTCAPTCAGRPDAWPRPTPSSRSAR